MSQYKEALYSGIPVYIMSQYKETLLSKEISFSTTAH